MFDQILRALKDRLMAPFSRWLGPRVSPMTISLAALIAGLGAAAALAVRRDAVALTLWLVNRTLDGLDGTHARVHARQSDLGAYVDIVLDFVVYAAIPVAIAAATASRTLALACAALLAMFVVNAASWMYLAAILERRQIGAAAHGELTTITMPSGVVAGAETVVFYAAFIIVPAWRVPLFLTMAGLVALNVVQRLVWAGRSL